MLITVPIGRCHSEFVPAEVSADSTFIFARFLCCNSQPTGGHVVVRDGHKIGLKKHWLHIKRNSIIISNYKRNSALRTTLVQEIQNCVSLWAKMQILTGSTLAWENIQNTGTRLFITNINITISHTSYQSLHSVSANWRRPVGIIKFFQNVSMHEHCTVAKYVLPPVTWLCSLYSAASLPLNEGPFIPSFLPQDHPRPGPPC